MRARKSWRSLIKATTGGSGWLGVAWARVRVPYPESFDQFEEISGQSSLRLNPQDNTLDVRLEPQRLLYRRKDS